MAEPGQNQDMYSALCPGAIKVDAPTLADGIKAAQIGGFGGVEVNPYEIAKLIETNGVEWVKQQFQEAEVKPAAWGLPGAWRAHIDDYEALLPIFPSLAEACASIGCTRVATWIMPGSNDLTFDEHLEFHRIRLGPLAKILEAHGCSLGLEFVGPLNSRKSLIHPFIYEMKPMLRMAQDVGPNVGLLLDCWHWYTSGGTVNDILELRAQDVVYVHVNDAPGGLERDEQMDHQRDLPGATGVIDIAGFLGALKKIEYDGPITPEPFKNSLADLPSDEDRLKLVGASMARILALV